MEHQHGFLFCVIHMDCVKVTRKTSWGVRFRSLELWCR